MKRLYKLLIPVASVVVLWGLFNWGYIGHLLNLTGQAAMDAVSGEGQASEEFLAEIDSLSASKFINPMWMDLLNIELPEDGEIPELPSPSGDDTGLPVVPGDDDLVPGGEDDDDGGGSSSSDHDLLKLGIRALLLYLREKNGDGIIGTLLSKLLEALDINIDIDLDADLGSDEGPGDFDLPDPDPDDDDDYQPKRKGRTLLLPDTLVERYGKENDSYDYAFRLMTRFTEMSLPADYEQLPVYYFKVLKPVIVTVGEVGARFGQEGGGTKYTFDDTITALIEDKVLEETSIFPSEEESDSSRIVLSGGTLVDCLEVPNGNTVFPLATPFLQRSQPRGYLSRPYRVYRVVTDVEVTQTVVAPAYGGDGGGTQYQFDQTIAELVGSGVLEECYNSLDSNYCLVYSKPEYCNYVTEKGTPIYPSTGTGAAFDDGFAEAPYELVLQPGTLVDRYGYDSGRFVSPVGTSYLSRALPVGSDALPYSIYMVKKPITVQAGRIQAWFGEPGGGMQYKFSNDTNIQQLIKDGYLVKVCSYEH